MTKHEKAYQIIDTPYDTSFDGDEIPMSPEDLATLKLARIFGINVSEDDLI